MAQALQWAQQELRQAEARGQVEKSTGAARSEIARALARARAWEAALREAASTAGPQDADVIVASAAGSAQFIRSGQSGPPKPGTVLREADQLLVHEGHIELRFHDASSLTLGPGSALRILQGPRSFPQQSAFALERGLAHWRGSPAAPGLTRLVGPRSMAQLRGGSVDVRVQPDGAAWLTVHEGSAELSARPEAAPGFGEAPWWDTLYH